MPALHVVYSVTDQKWFVWVKSLGFWVVMSMRAVGTNGQVVQIAELPAATEPRELAAAARAWWERQRRVKIYTTSRKGADLPPCDDVVVHPPVPVMRYFERPDATGKVAAV